MPVRSASTATGSSTEPSELTGMGRSIALGAAIGAVLAFAGVGGAIALWSHDLSVALGVGGMACFWGGLGFGSMLGGTLHLMRHTDEPYATSREAPERSRR